MEEMRKAALAYYANCSTEFKQEARNFFYDLDSDGDGRISKFEFIEFLKVMDMQSMLNNHKLFAELDRNGDGYLDFEEAVVFFYIGSFACFWCDHCGQHLKSVYFTCPDCFLDSQCYDLCAACYGSKRFIHQHRTFVDNHVMLSVARKELQEERRRSIYNQYSLSNSPNSGYSDWQQNQYSPSNSMNGTSDWQLQTSSSNGRSRKRDKLALALQLTQSSCALAACSIM